MLYDEERSKATLVFIAVTIAASIAGLYYKLTFNYCGMLAHATYSISVIGGFYIYIILASFFESYKSGNPHSLPQPVVMVLISLPTLGLFCMGISNLFLVLAIDEERSKKKNKD